MNDIIIEEKVYQEMKRNLNKTTDYFSLEEINDYMYKKRAAGF